MATDTPYMRSENPFGEDRAPAGEQSGRSSQTYPGDPPREASSQPQGGGALSPQDVAALKAAFTPQVLAVLARIGGGGSALPEPGATGMSPASGTMPEQPVAEPSLPRPATRLAQMMG